jgi:SAM-dependent methyltransferase
MSDKDSNEEQSAGETAGIYRKIKNLVPLGVRIFLVTRLKRLVNGFTRMDRELLANKYLRGEGIEIGALHNPLFVKRGTKVKYVDRLTKPQLRELYPELGSYEMVETDILDDGQFLRTISNSSQDFVIANHFLEHCPNPLEALRNIHRVMREGGFLYLALPDKRFTFDIDRPVTEMDHLFRDFEEGPEWSSRSHYEEWVELVTKASGAEAEHQIEDLMMKEAWIHFHVWTQTEMFELLSSVRKIGLHFDVECFLKNDAECVFVLRKMPTPAHALAGDPANYSRGTR